MKSLLIIMHKMQEAVIRGRERAIAVLWDPFTTGFLKSDTIDLLGQIILYCGSPAHWRVLSSALGLSSTSPLSYDN